MKGRVACTKSRCLLEGLKYEINYKVRMKIEHSLALFSKPLSLFRSKSTVIKVGFLINCLKYFLNTIIKKCFKLFSEFVYIKLK